MDLNVFAHNARAIALYRSCGFEEVGRIPDRFRVEGEVIDAILMTRKIRA